MQKRSMFLLEILIAMTLVILCIVPLLKGPLQMHQKEMEHLTQIETGRIAAWTFTEIVEKFLKKELRWTTLPKLEEKGPTYNLPSASFKLPSLQTKELPRKFRLKTLEEKHEPNGTIHKLIAIRLKIAKKKFTYRIILTKGPSSL